MANNKEKNFIKLYDYTKLSAMETDYLKSEEIYELLQPVETECNKGVFGNIYILNNDTMQEKDDEVRLVKNFNGSLMTQQYIGIIKCKDRTIFIGSRFDKGENNHFTNYVVGRALNIRSFIFPDMNIKVNRERALQNLLAIVFINQIKQAYKNGIYRQYRVYEENNDKLRGKIDVSRHINLNPMFNGKIAYSYREYTINNDINRLILTAFVALEKMERQFIHNLLNNNRDVKNYIYQLRNTMQPASRQEIPGLIKASKKIHHSIYKCWNDVRETAILILRHTGVHIAQSDNTKIFGVLLNMNYIWEKYLENVLKDSDSELTNMRVQESRGILFEESNSDSPKRTLKPDFYTEKMVLDAKYKSSWSEIVNDSYTDNSWPREDVFQILSYMYIYECKRGGVICPGKIKNSAKYTKISCKENENRKFAVFPLVISDKAEYVEFESEMSENEETLKRKIVKWLNDKSEF